MFLGSVFSGSMFSGWGFSGSVFSGSMFLGLMSSTSCIRTACPKSSTSMEQLVDIFSNLVDKYQTCCKVVPQVRYCHNITILLQPCVVNLVTFLLYHDCVRLVIEQPCNKSDNAIKLVSSC